MLLGSCASPGMHLQMLAMPAIVGIMLESLCLLQIKDRPDAVELVDSKAGYGIQLENVKFGYRPDMPILQVRSFQCVISTL